MADNAVEQSPEEILKGKSGAFATTLTRGNKQIRVDRALVLVEKTEKCYRRTIEDLTDSISAVKMERESMMDLSPTNAQNLTLASDFDERKYVDKDIELGVKVRNLEIKIEVATKRYEYLFGPYKANA
jgi:hypothetical protein